ncbi:IPT/TIG domain-containing protein, partial [Natronococcus sp.]|uniref:IPT/TIG domain-containing protein n=1 Tax=Natronococcus sp. TaxID=35747 RepID=UPI003A4E3BBE
MARTRNLLLIVTLAVALAACGGQPPVQPDPDPVPPEISAVAPSVAPRGATIVITGADFGADGSVTIGGVAAAITSWSDDEIQAVVAAGTPDAWQEVEVTTDEGADAFSPFFVGVAFTGAAADLQDFLDGQTAGTAVLLEAAAYDLSAAPDELLIDNRSLY